MNQPLPQTALTDTVCAPVETFRHMIKDIQFGEINKLIITEQQVQIDSQDSVMAKQRIRISNLERDELQQANRIDDLLFENMKDNANLKKARSQNRWIKIGGGILLGLVIVREVKR